MHWDWHWDWDWEHSHHDHPDPLTTTTRLWPWTKTRYLTKCPRRCHHWNFTSRDVDVCSRDLYAHPAETLWCHGPCVMDSVAIETGNEPDSCGKGTFKILLDIHNFRHDEVTVKARNNDTIVLEGKHKDNRSDKMPLCTTREFARKYKLPRHYDANQAKATLSSDGILTVIVPAPPPLDDVERAVEILQTGAFFGTDKADANDDDDADKKAIASGESQGDDAKPEKEASST